MTEKINLGAASPDVGDLAINELEDQPCWLIDVLRRNIPHGSRAA
ncbi:hypothetical protein [Burkholderia ambifaria]|nr:hypothetical protein [Burkholderia ambifaria]